MRIHQADAPCGTPIVFVGKAVAWNHEHDNTRQQFLEIERLRAYSMAVCGTMNTIEDISGFVMLVERFETVCQCVPGVSGWEVRRPFKGVLHFDCTIHLG